MSAAATTPASVQRGLSAPSPPSACKAELVCCPMNNGARMPVLGFAPIFTGGRDSCLQAALDAGFRHFVLEKNSVNDQLIGSVMKDWYRSGRLSRDDLFLAVKIDGSEIQKVTTNIPQRLHDLGCGYLDLVVLTNEFEDSVDSLKEKWTTLEKAVKTGYCRSLGISGPPMVVADLEELCKTCVIKPSLYLVEGRSKSIFAQLPRLEMYTKYRGIQTAINVRVDEISAQIPGGLKQLQKQVFQYSRSPSQVLVRYFSQRGLTVICESGESQTTTNCFKVLDFLISPDDMADITRILLKQL
ncbi:hypothetical protein CAPTEDRAFT_223303 [Capitella teleta]|uniref:NADP-dependent oxidoreductase domain-containing protein n=1 Tax=Capitella teleta TaxID=283909 RepID=R7VKF1_CAPTE|nr:hypothetical protein CAPTEDRAFT_223303 [Capitella teleta]|eukprot:ELU16705.1 hypothetical protein CAPTEDRAFT_223303 [Capitella teleta]